MFGWPWARISSSTSASTFATSASLKSAAITFAANRPSIMLPRACSRTARAWCTEALAPLEKGLAATRNSSRKSPRTAPRSLRAHSCRCSVASPSTTKTHAPTPVPVCSCWSASVDGTRAGAKTITDSDEPRPTGAWAISEKSSGTVNVKPSVLLITRLSWLRLPLHAILPAEGSSPHSSAASTAKRDNSCKRCGRTEVALHSQRSGRTPRPSPTRCR
mmetsp:Transcript_52645/g.145960  ORF Transcript_52645/g.145960 Transcript_52645/m.145960 type:complete len:218 (-) Transcript_52645:72-725(-)